MSPSLTAARLSDLLGPTRTPGPAYRDLADRIRLLVVDGRVADGTRLPSERELAAALCVSRTTTTRVYAELRDGGLLSSRQGSGSVVRLPFAASSASSLIVTPDQSDTIAMTYSAPTAPSGLGRAFESAVAKLPRLLATTGYLPDGLPALREMLAQRYTDRGFVTSPDQIVVTSGALGAISLIARAFVQPGTRMIVEAMSYPHAHDAFTTSGARLSPMPIGDDPWDETTMRTLAHGGAHRLAYLIPDFHNPTAAVMTDRKRGIFARELRRTDVITVVDESLREVNLDGTPLPPSLGKYHDGALVVDSSSKTIWGGLRVGWIRAPRDLVMPLVQARMTQDLGTPPFEQLVLTELLADEQVADAGRATLREARDHLVAELGEQLPQISVPTPRGGLNLWATLPGRISSPLTIAAARHGLLLTPGPRFFAGPGPAGEQHLRLPYTQPSATLTEAVVRLRAAYLEVTGAGAATATGATRPHSTLDLIA